MSHLCTKSSDNLSQMSRMAAKKNLPNSFTKTEKPDLRPAALLENKIFYS